MKMGEKRSGLHIYYGGYVVSSNPCHNPAGPGGGQFCGGGGTSGGSSGVEERLKDSIPHLRYIGIESELGSAENIANELERMNSELPAIKDILTQGEMPLLELRVADSTLPPNYGGVYRTGRLDGEPGAQIAITSLENIPSQAIQGQLKLGGWTFEDSASKLGCFRHELGHHVHQNLKYSEINRWENIYREQQVSMRISAYAATNASEGFAESFAAFTHPNYNSSSIKLPTEVHSYFNKLLKKES